NRKVRVLEGPEYEYLNDPDPFLNNTWETTRDISEMGMRLASSGEMPSVSVKNMISEAVSDGTIQLTPNGPIVLLRHRQTVGGYPRIFNVISADMDLLGQYSAKKTIRFEKVALDEAMKAANQKRCEVQTVRDKISR
ncbi:MAG: hypothetical protein GY866_23980, partial [Proteobacteria bacterium]|nr:hypothetical protein [Pseudomonadota bacterium]